MNEYTCRWVSFNNVLPYIMITANKVLLSSTSRPPAAVECSALPRSPSVGFQSVDSQFTGLRYPGILRRMIAGKFAGTLPMDYINL